MIPCFICGKDASTGWIKGLPPAPDSQKLALCSEHDTPAERVRVAQAWERLLQREIAAGSELAAYKAMKPPQILTVRFTAGGVLSFVCTHCEPTPHDTLRIATQDGSYTFIPMRQIAEYTLSPAPAFSPAPAPVALTEGRTEADEVE